MKPGDMTRLRPSSRAQHSLPPSLLFGSHASKFLVRILDFTRHLYETHESSQLTNELKYKFRWEPAPVLWSIEALMANFQKTNKV